MLVINTELDPEESLYQAAEPKDSDSEEEITGDNIKESSNLSPLEIIPVITEFTDVSPKHNTLILPGVTHVITKFVVFSEDFPDKLSPTRDIQHTIELVSGASLSDLSQHRIDLVKYIELERQVDELLESSSNALSINTHVSEDKFWSCIVTKDVDQIKNVTIYSEPCLTTP